MARRLQRVALCSLQDAQGHTQFIMQLEPRMVAFGFMAGRESVVKRRRAIGPKEEEEEEVEAEAEVKEKVKGRKREKDGAVNCRTSIRGLYSRGMSYMPPAVANALFIARLFIISSSYTYVADPGSKHAFRRPLVCAHLSSRWEFLLISLFLVLPFPSCERNLEGVWKMKRQIIEFTLNFRLDFFPEKI